MIQPAISKLYSFALKYCSKPASIAAPLFSTLTAIIFGSKFNEEQIADIANRIQHLEKVNEFNNIYHISQPQNFLAPTISVLKENLKNMSETNWLYQPQNLIVIGLISTVAFFIVNKIEKDFQQKTKLEEAVEKALNLCTSPFDWPREEDTPLPTEYSLLFNNLATHRQLRSDMDRLINSTQSPRLKALISERMQEELNDAVFLPNCSAPRNKILQQQNY